MIDLEKRLSDLKQHLRWMQAEYDSEFSMLIGRLEEALNASGRPGPATGDQEKLVQRLERRAQGQSNIIESLREEAEESRVLRSEVHERDLEIARLTRELDAKNDLIRALRSRQPKHREPAPGEQLAEESLSEAEEVALTETEADALREIERLSEDAAITS